MAIWTGWGRVLCILGYSPALSMILRYPEISFARHMHSLTLYAVMVRSPTVSVSHSSDDIPPIESFSSMSRKYFHVGRSILAWSPLIRMTFSTILTRLSNFCYDGRYSNLLHADRRLTAFRSDLPLTSALRFAEYD